MCTVVILRRPGHAWPLILAANRDEMLDRPWRPPGRHWQDRPHVVAGKDDLGGGSWLGLNDDGVVAGILNRKGSLGPAPGMSTRGELVLAALEHGDAGAAAREVAARDPHAYRPFNMVIADRREAFWLRHAGADMGIEVMEVPPGLSMITAHDRNDRTSARIRRFLPRFRRAPPPDPDADDWAAWEALLASRAGAADHGREGAMAVVTEAGFGTVSGSLIALPADPPPTARPLWRFAAGLPGAVPFRPVEM